MFLRKTVFILGAGASWHYGYPTGEGLVDEVLAKARIAANYFRDSRQNISYTPRFVEERIRQNTSIRGTEVWDEVWKMCEDFADRLRRVNPPVIDYFLGFNPQHGELGKLLIAWVIMEREARFRDQGNAVNRTGSTSSDATRSKDDWHRFLLSRLTSGCRQSEDLLKNNVSFLTFNYDTSLEWNLRNGLGALATFEQKEIDEFMSDERTLHVYGYIAPDKTIKSPLQARGGGGFFKRELDSRSDREEWKALLDTVYEASKGIRTIDPHEKTLDETVLKAAAAKIREAECVYILGFGFDMENCRRLGLNEALKAMGASSPKQVYFTNFGDVTTINKAASRVFSVDLDSAKNGMIRMANPLGHWSYEKSVRNCYEALSRDFGTPEAEVTPLIK